MVFFTCHTEVGMTTDQARIFLSLSDTLSFTETAALHNMTQATVSKQIHALETELGILLFDRSRRRVSLTVFGRSFQTHCETIRNAYEESLRLARLHAREKISEIQLVSLPILQQYRLLEAIRDFEETHPETRVIMREYEEQDLLASLRASACDLAIARKEMFGTDTLRTEPLATDELCLFVRRDHRLADRLEITSGDLDQLPLMLMPKQTGVCRMAEQYIEEAGIHPFILQHARIETLIGSIEAGKCGSLLMRRIETVFHTEAMKVIPLRPPVYSHVVASFSPEGERKPVARKFVRHLQRFLAGIEPGRHASHGARESH